MIPNRFLTFFRRYSSHFLETSLVALGRFRRLVFRRYWRGLWRLRWLIIRARHLVVSRLWRRNLEPGNLEPMPRPRVAYINLDRRPDRNSEIVAELARLGVENPYRMTATDGHSWPKSAFSRNYLGSMGCAYSHRNLLREFDTGENTIMVCEDDLEILVDPRYLWAVVDEFLGDPRLDV